MKRKRSDKFEKPDESLVEPRNLPDILQLRWPDTFVWIPAFVKNVSHMKLLQIIRLPPEGTRQDALVKWLIAKVSFSKITLKHSRGTRRLLRMRPRTRIIQVEEGISRIPGNWITSLGNSQVRKLILSHNDLPEFNDRNKKLKELMKKRRKCYMGLGLLFMTLNRRYGLIPELFVHIMGFVNKRHYLGWSRFTCVHRSMFAGDYE